MKNWYKIASMNPWEMTQKEFIAYHKTGFIRSDAYQQYSKSLDYVKKDKYPVIYSVKKFGDKTIEFRKSGEKLRYCKIAGEDREILRDENGLAVYLTDEEIKEKGLLLFDASIAAFDGDQAIGLASDEWGTDGIWVIEDYQHLGIGTYLLTELRKQFKPERRIGQMTTAGWNMSKSYHKRMVMEAIESGQLTPSNPKYEEIIKDYPGLAGLADLDGLNKSEVPRKELVEAKTKQTKQTKEDFKKENRNNQWYKITGLLRYYNIVVNRQGREEILDSMKEGVFARSKRQAYAMAMRKYPDLIHYVWDVVIDEKKRAEQDARIEEQKRQENEPPTNYWWNKD